MTVNYKVVNRFRLNGTIDPHDPVGVTVRITGGSEPFRLTMVTANLGRGYDSPAVFKRNVLRILNKVGEKEYVVLFLQEMDEADSAKEKVIFVGVMEPGTQLVRWETREPIVVSPGVRVSRKRKIMTMDKGTAIGGPVGTGPERMFVSCIIEIMGVKIGLSNQHPHRYTIANAKVKKARENGEVIAQREVADLVELCNLVFNAGDFNTARYPKMHPQEKVLHKDKRGYDQIRGIKCPAKDSTGTRKAAA